VSDKFNLSPKLMPYWMGTPCKWTNLDGLEGLPQEDLGGRALFFPTNQTPAMVFDLAMPNVGMISANAGQFRFSPMPQDAKVFLTSLAQGIQFTWLFTSQEFSRQAAQIARLEARVKQLEALVSVGETDAQN
jgi:hypothetical protein